ncbi:protein lethal(2)essential for life-like [Bombyx mori]|uniref:SHSP domain-containing protein n=1 Tax=Bombyx mori TaxID=7091 RepID=A0A8R1WPL3_BOMMO|nr:protein lethal(2)essential for life [Bombyx mori]XP_037876893.1 protein lethal(2)essential for life-like [Bombyx mori]
MALLPYLLDDLRPHRIRDQLFGMDLSPDDFLADIIDRPIVRMKYVRPWRNLAAAARDVGSTIKTDRDKLQINLDVQHFTPEEISVKTADGYIVIEGQHEEKQDEHGYVTRHFKRRYALPEGCKPETVESRLSSDGVLTVIAPKSSQSKDERAVPITHTGPVRRKQHDDDQINGNAEEETKSPQKKRKR